MTQREFTVKFKALVGKRLIDCVGEENIDTKAPPLERKSHAYSFLNVVLNSMPAYMGDMNIAGYKIDDANEVTIGESGVQAERERLLNDVETTEDILKFIVTKLYFK